MTWTGRGAPDSHQPTLRVHLTLSDTRAHQPVRSLRQREAGGPRRPAALDARDCEQRRRGGQIASGVVEYLGRQTSVSLHGARAPHR